MLLDICASWDINTPLCLECNIVLVYTDRIATATCLGTLFYIRQPSAAFSMCRDSPNSRLHQIRNSPSYSSGRRSSPHSSSPLSRRASIGIFRDGPPPPPGKHHRQRVTAVIMYFSCKMCFVLLFHRSLKSHTESSCKLAPIHVAGEIRVQAL